MGQRTDIYDVIDKNGNVVGTVRYPEGGSLYEDAKKNRESGAANTVYGGTSDSQEQYEPLFSPDDIKAATSFSLDKKTGKITVKAPSAALKNETFKKQVTDAASAISQNYKLNPDYKYALMNNSEETKTSEEWVDEIKGDIADMAAQAVSIEKMKAKVKADDGVDLSDEDVIKMSAIALEYNDESGQTVKVTDDTIQALPSVIKNTNVFKDLEGWDSDSHAVKWGELKKHWDREKHSDDDILEVFDIVDKYFKDKDFSDPTEYAEMVAFRQFIYGKDPDVAFWRNVAETTGEAILGVLTGAGEFDLGVLNSIESLSNKIKDVTDQMAGYEPTDEDNKTFAKDNLEKFEKIIEERRSTTAKLSDVRAGWGAVANAITPIALELMASIYAGKWFSNYAAGKMTQIIDSSMRRFEATAKTLENTASLIGLTSETTNIEKAIKGANDITKAFYAGTDLMLKLMSTSQRIQVITQAFKTSTAIAKTVGVISKGADILAQAVVDITLVDSKLFREFMETDNDEAKAYALQQLTQNAAGEITGVVIGRGIIAFSRTPAGLVLQSKTAPRIAKWKAWWGQRVDDMKTFLHRGNAQWLLDKTNKLRQESIDATGKWYSRLAYNRAGKYERKLQNYTERRILRAANEKIGDMAGELSFRGNSWDDILEKAKEIKGNMADTLADANNLINQMYTRDVSATVAKFFMNDPELLGARDSYLDALTKVLKAEDAAGLASKSRRAMKLQENLLEGGKKVGKGAEKINTKKNAAFQFGFLNEKTNEYILARYRVERADAVIELSNIAEDVNGAKKEKEHWEKVIAAFRESQPQELVDAADNLLVEGKKLSGLTQDLRVHEGVLSGEALESMRTSGYFDGGYLRTQRATEWLNYRKEGGALKIAELRDSQQFGWGDTETPWQDISVVLFDDINEVARQTTRKKMVEMLKDLGIKVDIIVDENTTRIISETPKKLTSEAISKIQKHTDNLVKDSDTALFNHFFDKKKTNMLVNQAHEAAVESGGKLASAKARKNFKITRTDRHHYFNAINEGDLDDLLVSDPRSAFNVGVVDDESLWEFRNKLDTKHRKMLDEKMVGGLGDKYHLPADTLRGQLANNVKEAQIKGGAKIKRNDLRSIYTLENFKQSALDDYNFMDNFKRSYAEKNFNESADEIIMDLKRDAAILRANTTYKENWQRLNALRKKYDLPGFDDTVADDIEDFIEDAIDNNLKNEEINKVMSALADGTAGVDDLAEYTTLQSLYKNRKQVEGSFFSSAKKHYNAQITKDIRAKYKGDRKLLTKKLEGVNKMAESWANEVSDMLVTRIEERYAETVNRLMQQGSPLVSEETKKSVFKRIAELNKEVTGAMKTPNLVKTYGAYGYEEYVELSPTIADMFMTMPRPLRRGAFGTLQQEFVRAFRFGTTGGLVPGSLVNQAFRDVGNAVVMGDAVKTNMRVERELAEQFGERFAQEYQKNIPDVYATLLKQSQETGEDINRLIARREMKLGELNVSAQLEKNIYQFGKEAKIARNERGTYDTTVFDRITDGLDEALTRAEFLNTARETYLRKRVYNNNLLKSMQEGLSVQQSRKVAEFMQSEATTNFSRQSYHLANLTKTVPYLGSAINGQKSFWRLAAWDPVGTATRIIGGYVVPVIALTNMSLANEEDRRIYKQIPEYEKAEHLTFVLNGQIISIPIPQEISNFVVPVQHMIESLQGVSDHSFNELLANDLLGAFPVELDGFMNIDADKLLEKDILHKNLLPGFAKISSTLMPPLVKSGFMMVTGYDPYTMKPIQRTNVGVDNETGEQLVMDYTTSSAAQWIGSIMGNYISAPMAQKVLTNLFGQGGVLIADSIVTMAQSVTDPEKNFLTDGIAKVSQNYMENALNRLYVQRYGEESNMAWNRAVASLWEEKKALLKDEKYIADLKAIRSGDLSEDALKTVTSRVKSRQQEYMQHVLDVANNLKKEYDGTFDRNKFASVLSLMNLDTDHVNELPFNSATTYLSQQEWNINKAAAVETMASMGFKGPDDGSIFGYYYEDPTTGKITIQYNSPVSILNFNLSKNYQDDIAYADISKIIKEKGLYDKMQAYDKQINAIYNKKKLSKQDRANIDQLKISWNSEVAKEIAPVIAKMTAESVIGSEKIRDLIETYIYVPDSYAVNNKGRYASLGDNGSKKAAYFDSWIKRMFSVNDKYKGQY